MATKYLGESFDIHGGGLENQFPHHECEIAQSHALDHPFARVWLHNNMINVDGQKMGKSLGNFVTVQNALSRYSPETIRNFLLMTHYRTPANYTEEGLEGAQSGVNRLQNALKMLQEDLKSAKDTAAPNDAALLAAAGRAQELFHVAMDDDFNTPSAIAALFDFARESNSLRGPNQLSKSAIERAIDVYVSLGEDVLGITVSSAEDSAGAEAFIDLLLSIRQDLKTAKQFALADLIRDRLTALQVIVKDGKDGVTWSRG
jgi:cysteinyl-tRNA synthetase